MSESTTSRGCSSLTEQFGVRLSVAIHLLCKVACLREHICPLVHCTACIWVVLQVGIVRQVETAAVKASEKSRGPFQRQLTASYTAATIEAGERADVGEPAAAPSGNGWSSAGLCAHLLVVIEGDAKSSGGTADLLCHMLCHMLCFEEFAVCSMGH